MVSPAEAEQLREISKCQILKCEDGRMCISVFGRAVGQWSQSWVSISYFSKYLVLMCSNRQYSCLYSKNLILSLRVSLRATISGCYNNSLSIFFEWGKDQWQYCSPSWHLELGSPYSSPTLPPWQTWQSSSNNLLSSFNGATHHQRPPSWHLVISLILIPQLLGSPYYSPPVLP